ncbi:599c9e30-48f7-4c1d-8873-37aa2a576b2d [Sclerotinia trifoliorum]|uniref:599c9e30-48f7-4c1d-8873-37aa2a576b2d n=1 Tax=Sclerotinia trifoliorum TaxID=28548 RepID=A0A8H2W1W6_9HELO|nr:599c9e30-48f7-4c1d-8873-37aa2a576b2d [Sclerotinia trifoliorum]
MRILPDSYSSHTDLTSLSKLEPHLEVIPHVTPLFRPTHHLLHTSFSPAKCANTQGTTTSTLHVLTQELTTSLHRSMAAKTDNAQRDPMNATLSFPDIVPCAHEYQAHHGTSTSHQEFQHISFDSTYGN